jgi:demethylmenaquinone methyltransferase / 2-methoxy-6-polyprenyl-1,4-benzoquinol methylase
MSLNDHQQHKQAYVQEMFSRIASRYDLMNRLMTAGQDLAWRKFVIDTVNPAPGTRLLDLGTGTGDMLVEAYKRCPTCMGFGGDLTIDMMCVGAQKPGRSLIRWIVVDAQQLPFEDGIFDAVVSGFLLRNVVDLDVALQEQYRVLKPGGLMVALDTTRPPGGLLSPLIRFHLKTVIPLLGRLVTGEVDAYRYLPESTSEFLRAEELAARISLAGFSNIMYVRRMFGTVAIHWGHKLR